MFSPFLSADDFSHIQVRATSTACKSLGSKYCLPCSSSRGGSVERLKMMSLIICELKREREPYVSVRFIARLKGGGTHIRPCWHSTAIFLLSFTTLLNAVSSTADVEGVAAGSFSLSFPFDVLCFACAASGARVPMDARCESALSAFASFSVKSDICDVV